MVRPIGAVFWENVFVFDSETEKRNGQLKYCPNDWCGPLALNRSSKMSELLAKQSTDWVLMCCLNETSRRVAQKKSKAFVIRNVVFVISLNTGFQSNGFFMRSTLAWIDWTVGHEFAKHWTDLRAFMCVCMYVYVCVCALSATETKSGRRLWSTDCHKQTMRWLTPRSGFTPSYMMDESDQHWTHSGLAVDRSN